MPKEKIKKIYNHLKKWYEKYERVLLPGTLFFGVIVDIFTFTSININTAFIILGLHILFSGSAIYFLNAYDIKFLKKENHILQFIRLICPLIIQFSFGALLSASFIFYIFSGSIYVSWPFILLLIILMISNDVFRKYYLLARVQISIFFFLLLSTSSIVLPFILQKLGATIFISSGILALLIILIYILLLNRFTSKDKFNIKKLAIPIISIFIFINFLYFLNIIPPIPLSLKEAVIGHKINTANGNYTILVEKTSLIEKIIPGITIHKQKGESISLYTAIFAPGNLKTDIYHDWQHYENKKWVSYDRFSYSIFGGKKTGFRGYSIKNNLPEGKWRVNIEIESKQVVGRVYFNIVEVDIIPELIEKVK